MSTKIKKRTLTVSVWVPSAGKVTVSGKGVSSGSKSANGRETLTFKLNQKKAVHLPAEGINLSTKIKVTFRPSKGKTQSKSEKVKFEK